MTKVRKAKLSFLYMTGHLVLFYISTKYPSKYSKQYLNYRADTKYISNKTKRNNSKSKKARVAILVHDMLSCPVLHFYQVSSKYSRGYSSYRADKKFYADANANRIRPKNNMSPPPFGRGGSGGGGHNEGVILYIKQEAHGPQFAHLSKTAIAYLEMPCNILPVLPQQLGQKFDSAVKRSKIILGSLFEQTWKTWCPRCHTFVWGNS